MNNAKAIYKPDESAEQEAVFQWAALNSGKYPELEFMYHVANEGKRTARYGAELKRMGLKNGVPDICLPAPRGNYHGLYIEMKVGRNTPTASQAKYLGFLTAQGYCAVWCIGADNAINIIKAYLKGEFYRDKENRLDSAEP